MVHADQPYVFLGTIPLHCVFESVDLLAVRCQEVAAKAASHAPAGHLAQRPRIAQDWSTHGWLGPLGLLIVRARIFQHRVGKSADARRRMTCRNEQRARPRTASAPGSIINSDLLKLGKSMT